MGPVIAPGNGRQCVDGSYHRFVPVGEDHVCVCGRRIRVPGRLLRVAAA